MFVLFWLLNSSLLQLPVGNLPGAAGPADPDPSTLPESPSGPKLGYGWEPVVCGVLGGNQQTQQD